MLFSRYICMCDTFEMIISYSCLFLLGAQSGRDAHQCGHQLLCVILKEHHDEVHHRAKHQRRDGQMAGSLLQTPQKGNSLTVSSDLFHGNFISLHHMMIFFFIIADMFFFVYFSVEQITDLKKEGKLVLPTEGDNAAAPAATPPAPASPKDAAAGGLTSSLSSSSSGTQENPVVTSKKAGAKGGVSEGFMAMLSFREESLGDQIKFALSMVLALYLVINFIRWQLISRKLDNLEASVRKLEALAQELLEAKRKSLF